MVDRGITLYLCDLGARRGWVVSTTPRPLYPRERPGTRCTGGLWAPGLVWTFAINLAPTGIRFPDRPARSQSLYQLGYPAHVQRIIVKLISKDISSIEVSTFSEHLVAGNWFEIPVTVYLLYSDTSQKTVAFIDIAVGSSNINYQPLLQEHVFAGRRLNMPTVGNMKPQFVPRSKHTVSSVHYLLLVVSLKLSGVIPLLPIYAFVAWTGKILFYFYIRDINCVYCKSYETHKCDTWSEHWVNKCCELQRVVVLSCR
jgi:hypothetical protein